MLTKIENNLKFSNKRNYKLVTPCCSKLNNDGKFVNYKYYGENYGYCHSCGVATLPPTKYIKENGEEYFWDKSQNKLSEIKLLKVANLVATSCEKKSIDQKFIQETEIWKHFHHLPENNLLQYLRKNYNNEKVEDAKEIYILGSSNDGGTMFWNINMKLQVQKLKIAYYDEQARRKNKFKVPYKNDNGYYSCFFGEHLLSYQCNKNKTIILVESEKTAIIGYILMPQYVWLAYSGCNGLTTDKARVLKGFRVLIIPDISENAVSVATKKVIQLRQNGIDIKLWDMTEGKTDEQLKLEGIYNNDLEDFFRDIKKEANSL